MWRQIGIKPPSSKPIQPKHYKLYSPPSPNTSTTNLKKLSFPQTTKNQSFSNLNDSKFFPPRLSKQPELSLETEQQHLKYLPSKISTSGKQLQFNDFKNMMRSSKIMNETTKSILNLPSPRVTGRGYSKQEYDGLNQKYQKSLKEIEGLTRSVEGMRKMMGQVWKQFESLKLHCQVVADGIGEELESWKEDIGLIGKKMVEDWLAKTEYCKDNFSGGAALKDITNQQNNKPKIFVTNLHANNNFSKQLANLRNKIFQITQLKQIFLHPITHSNQQNNSALQYENYLMPNQNQTIQSIFDVLHQAKAPNKQRLSY